MPHEPRNRRCSEPTPLTPALSRWRGRGRIVGRPVENRQRNEPDGHTNRQKLSVAVPSPGGEGSDAGEPFTKTDLR
jgi:hypothetical protein